MSKGGSTTSQVQIPSYLSDAARRNLARADVISRIGYTPYFGPDVAAMTPMQQAAIQGTNQMASAFGLPSVSDPMAGMPQPQDFGGMQAYSSAPMYEQSLQQLAQQRPAQYQAIEGMFNPTGGTSYGGGYGSGGGYGTTTSGGGVNLGNLAGTALAGYGAYKAIPAVASKVGGLLGSGGIGALPTASQLAAITPYAAGAVAAPYVAGKYVVGPIADALGFGSKERAKRAELANWSEQSGLNDYKAMVESVSGMPYGDYIESKMPPLSPYQTDLQSLQSSGAGDRSYEEDQLLQFYQTPQGKQRMADFYASNPDWYTPTGERVFPEGILGDMDRAAAAWFASGQKGPSPNAGIIKNVLNRSDYPILTRGRGGV